MAYRSRVSIYTTLPATSLPCNDRHGSLTGTGLRYRVPAPLSIATAGPVGVSRQRCEGVNSAMT